MSSWDNERVSRRARLGEFQLQMDMPFLIRQMPLRGSSKYERDGHWNEKQRLKYAVFLSFFENLFKDPFSKKNIRIYDMMSDMIITRNANQCRSHHQKMEKYRNTIPEIINSIAEKYEPRVYREQELKYLILIKNLLENQQKYVRTPPSTEEVKYVYTDYLPTKINLKQEKKVQLTKVTEVHPGDARGKERELEDVEAKNKEDRIKTADAYLPERLYMEEDAMNDKVPAMELLDPKLEEEAFPLTLLQNSQMSYPQLHTQNVYFPTDQGLSLTIQGKLYYEQQIKFLQMKREWHGHNAHQLSNQLNGEQQAIRRCEQTIKLCQLTLKGVGNN